MSNEVKIGIFAIISIIMLIWGFNFLKGQNILEQAATFKVEYDNVAYLSKSEPILLNGYPAGIVTDIYPVKGSLEKMMVEFTVDRIEAELPKQTVAVIVDQSLMGGKAIELRTNIPCSNSFPCDERENYLRGTTEGFLASMIGSPDELNVYMKNIQKNFAPILDTLQKELKGNPDDEGLRRTMYELAQTARNMNALTTNLNSMIQSTSGSFDKIGRNLAGITETINQNNEDISTLMSNAATFSESLNKMELDSTTAYLNSSLQEMEATLQSTQQLMKGLNEVMAKVEKGEGSLGKLLTDEKLYDQFSTLAIHLDTLVKDFQQRPYRYVPLKNRNRVLKYDAKDQ